MEQSHADTQPMELRSARPCSLSTAGESQHTEAVSAHHGWMDSTDLSWSVCEWERSRAQAGEGAAHTRVLRSWLWMWSDAPVTFTSSQWWTVPWNWQQISICSSLNCLSWGYLQQQQMNPEQGKNWGNTVTAGIDLIMWLSCFSIILWKKLLSALSKAYWALQWERKRQAWGERWGTRYALRIPVWITAPMPGSSQLSQL